MTSKSQHDQINDEAAARLLAAFPTPDPATFPLAFKPQAQRPTESGTCVIYNQCDGFHLVEAVVIDGEFCGFRTWAGRDYIGDDFYVAWARMPDSYDALYELFADKPVEGKSAHDVTMERLARQAAHGLTPISELVELPDGTVVHKDDVPAGQIDRKDSHD